MADILQANYKVVFSDPTVKTDINIPPNDSQHTINDIEFNEEDFIKAINQIPTFSAAGPDKFPAIILKECAAELSKPMFIIWRYSLDNGKIPHKFLQQTIVLERVLRVKLITFIETNNILSTDQYGFRSGRSCVTQLISHFENIYNILDICIQLL